MRERLVRGSGGLMWIPAHLDDADIDAVLQEVGGEGVAQGMGTHPLGDPG
jgi:hypothetical protein